MGQKSCLMVCWFYFWFLKYVTNYRISHANAWLN